MTQGSAEETKKIFAAGLLGLGAISLRSSGSVASESSLQQDVANRVLVFAHDYNPELSLERITTLQQGTTNTVLSEIDSIGNPDDYAGYVVRYLPAGEYTLAFVRRPDSLPKQTSFGFDPGSATFFDPDANLIQVGIDGNVAPEEDDGETPTEEEMTPEDEGTTPAEAETTTPEETTPEEDEQQDVIVTTRTTENE